MTWEETAEGAVFHINNTPTKADGSFYSYYHLLYWIMPKDAEACERMNVIAGLNKGKAKFDNTAYMLNTPPSTVEFTHSYNPISKSKTVEGDEVLYTLNINKPALS